MTILRLSWKNIRSKPLNTVLSVLLFALSTGLITFLVLFNQQFKNGLENNLAGIDLVIGAKGSPLQLILNSMYHIDAPTGNIPIGEAAPFLNPKHPLLSGAVPLSLGDSYGAFRIAGTTPTIFKLYGATKVEGDIYKNDFEVVVGFNVAKQLHLHIEDHFYSTHGLEDNPDLAHDHGAPFVIKGILQPTGTVLDQLILTTPQTVWKVHEHDTTSTDSNTVDHKEHKHSEDAEHKHNNASVIIIDTVVTQVITDSILVALRAQPEKEITSILLQFKNRTNIQSLNFLRNINVNTGLMAASPAMEINRLYAMMGSGTEALRYIAILIAIVAAISIFISLYTSLKERRYEMALMRVSGAGPGKLFMMIIGEGLWISIIGLILGVIIGHIGMHLAGDILEQGYKYRFSGMLWVHEEIYIIGGGLLIGLLASIIPAMQGSRIDLHRTLAES
jgi:putative ABC transport system permease protein